MTDVPKSHKPDARASHARITGPAWLAPRSTAAVAVGLAAATSVLVPRGSWACVVVVAVVLAGATRFDLRSLLRPMPVTLGLLGFAAWAAASGLWVVVPSSGLEKALLLGLVVVATHLSVRLADAIGDHTAATAAPPRALPRLTVGGLALGLCVAMAFTGCLLAVEVWTDQMLLRRTLETFPALLKPGKHVMVSAGQVTEISSGEINRRVCVWFLLWWPTVALVLHAIERTLARRLLLTLCLLAGLIAIATGHQSTQLAVLVSLMTFGVFVMVPRAARSVVATAWCVLVLAVVPFSNAVYDNGLSNAPWLFHSARERVALWGYTASRVAQRPLTGRGADTTPVLNSAMDAAGRGADVRYSAIRPGRHSHNWYLQTWYELGAVGALIMLAAGGLMLRVIFRLPHGVQGIMLAQFTLVAAMVATSYGLWQFWLHSAIAASVVLSSIVAATRRTLGPNVTSVAAVDPAGDAER